MKKKNFKKSYLVVICACFLIILTGFVFHLYNVHNLKEDNKILKLILKSEISVYEVNLVSGEADNLYEIASMSYENYNFKDVELYCKLAREKYLEAGQGYRDIKATLKSEDNEIINTYKKMLDELIKISDNMYEACEHFESASRYYSKVDWDSYTHKTEEDKNIAMGNKEIDKMNEKIRAHDKAVENFNHLSSELKQQINELI